MNRRRLQWLYNVYWIFIGSHSTDSVCSESYLQTTFNDDENDTLAVVDPFDFVSGFLRQIGTLLGLAAGSGSLQLIGGEPWINMSAYGFIGWGVGAYLGHHRSGKTSESRPPKLKVHQGGR